MSCGIQEGRARKDTKTILEDSVFQTFFSFSWNVIVVTKTEQKLKVDVDVGVDDGVGDGVGDVVGVDFGVDNLS